MINKILKSPLTSTIVINANSISYKTLANSKEIFYEEIDYIDFKEGTIALNGELIIKENGNLHRIMFLYKYNNDIKEFVGELKIVNKEVVLSTRESLNEMNSLLPHSYNVTYLGGHPQLPKEGNMTLSIMNHKVTLGGLILKINLENITNARLESETEIRSRYTATRIALLGVFALAFKKNKNISHKYLTIECDYKGVSISVILTGNNVMQALGPIISCIEHNNRMTQSKEQPVVVNSSFSKADEILKLKGLLDQGILTKEEFDVEKAKLLT